MTNVAKLKTSDPTPPEAPFDPLAKLREPFPANQISKLPKETKPQREEREKDRSKGVKCNVCGGWHHKNAVHLDYVGHAAATDRLLDADPRWNWTPVPDPASRGLPVVPGGMWIELTVDGVTRLGFGDAAGKTGGDAVKEIIGDAIRNAGMRFGMALDLWHKGDLHAPAESSEEQDGEQGRGRSAGVVAAESSLLLCQSSEDVDTWEANNKAVLADMDRDERKVVLALHKAVREKYPTKPKAEKRQPIREEAADFRADELEGAFND